MLPNVTDHGYSGNAGTTALVSLVTDVTYKLENLYMHTRIRAGMCMCMGTFKSSIGYKILDAGDALAQAVSAVTDKLTPIGYKIPAAS